MEKQGEPYITPRKLLGDKSLPEAVASCKLAFVCYCPMPFIFDRYKLNIRLDDRYFIHSHNSHVMFCDYLGSKFIVIAEVYGGPMSVTTVEELKHYGIKTIIGIGFVGSLTSRLPTGRIIVAEKALVEPGTTPHYCKNTDIVGPTLQLKMGGFSQEYVWTTNALYREYKEDVETALKFGCSVVNMDTSHLYAACKMLDIACEYYAVVSDVIGNDDNCTWDNSLTKAVSENSSPVTTSQADMVLSILAKLSINDKKFF